jgi:hypothetical protein
MAARSIAVAGADPLQPRSNECTSVAARTPWRIASVMSLTSHLLLLIISMQETVPAAWLLLLKKLTSTGKPRPWRLRRLLERELRCRPPFDVWCVRWRYPTNPATAIQSHRGSESGFGADVARLSVSVAIDPGTDAENGVFDQLLTKSGPGFAAFANSGAASCSIIVKLIGIKGAMIWLSRCSQPFLSSGAA